MKLIRLVTIFNESRLFWTRQFDEPRCNEIVRFDYPESLM